MTSVSPQSWLRKQGYDRQQRQALELLAATLGLASADASTIGAVASQVRHALGTTNLGIGVLVGASAGVGAVMTLPAGVLVDRLHRARLLAVATLLWGAITVLSGLAPSFGFLLVVRLVLGATTAVAGPGVASLLGDSFPDAERGRAYGVVLAGELVGAGVGFGVAGVLASVSWRAGCAVLGPPSLVLAWHLWRMAEPGRGCMASPAEHATAEVQASWRDLGLVRTVRYVLSVPTNVVLVLAGACSYYFFDGIRTFGVEFVSDQYRVSQSVATLIVLLVGVGAVAGVLVAGRLGDRLESSRFAAGRVLVAAVALGGSVVAFVPGLLLRSAPLSVPLLMLGAFGLAAANPPLNAGRLQVVPPGLWGRAEGVRGVLRQVGDTSGPLAFGFVADEFFNGTRRGLQGSFLLNLSSLVVGAAILLVALRTYPRDVQAARVAAVKGPSAHRRRAGGE
jgi:predicted MFS family arabinose efflux permease